MMGGHPHPARGHSRHSGSFSGRLDLCPAVLLPHLQTAPSPATEDAPLAPPLGQLHSASLAAGLPSASRAQPPEPSVSRNHQVKGFAEHFPRVTKKRQGTRSGVAATHCPPAHVGISSNGNEAQRLRGELRAGNESAGPRSPQRQGGGPRRKSRGTESETVPAEPERSPHWADDARGRPHQRRRNTLAPARRAQRPWRLCCVFLGPRARGVSKGKGVLTRETGRRRLFPRGLARTPLPFNLQPLGHQTPHCVPGSATPSARRFPALPSVGAPVTASPGLSLGCPRSPVLSRTQHGRVASRVQRGMDHRRF